MTTATINITTPFICRATVEQPTATPAYVAAVDFVKLPLEGELVDVTLQVLCDRKLFQKVEARVLEEYGSAGK